MAYNPNVPTTGHNASQDYVAMQQNYAQIDTSYNTDHIPLESAINVGLHSQVRFATNQSAPTLINSAVSELFANNPNATSELFFKNGVPKTYQLTNLPVTTGVNGGTAGGSLNFFDLPWNMRMYFGQTANTVTTGATVVFPVAYTTLYTAQATSDDPNGVACGLQPATNQITLARSIVGIVLWWTLGRI